MTAKVLITGATGAIARHLLPGFLSAGFEVRATYRAQPLPLEGVEWHQMDFLETFDFAELVVGCDAVVHLAGDTHESEHLMRLNVEMTEALLKTAQSLAVRYFGFLSTVAVYGSPWRKYVDEYSPILDLGVPLEKQCHAEPHVLDYLRSKILAEQSIQAITKDIAADIYRSSTVVDETRLLEAGDWTTARKLASSYRRTHYIYVKDLSEAIVHLTKRGLASEMEIPREAVEVFNVVDEACGTYEEILNAAFEATQDARFKLSMRLPIIADMVDDIAKYKRLPRLPLGVLHFSNAKLQETGFDLPHGVEEVLGRVLEQCSTLVETLPSVPVPALAAGETSNAP